MSADSRLMNNVRHMDNVISVCFGCPEERDLPQIADVDAVVIDLLHRSTGKPIELLDVELHHQTDPSYQDPH